MDVLLWTKVIFIKVDDVDENGNPIKRYASGRISTTGLVSPLYGFFEVRYPQTHLKIRIVIQVRISTRIPI